MTDFTKIIQTLCTLANLSSKITLPRPKRFGIYSAISWSTCNDVLTLSHAWGLP